MPVTESGSRILLLLSLSTSHVQYSTVHTSVHHQCEPRVRYELNDMGWGPGNREIGEDWQGVLECGARSSSSIGRGDNEDQYEHMPIRQLEIELGCTHEKEKKKFARVVDNFATVTAWPGTIFGVEEGKE